VTISTTEEGQSPEGHRLNPLPPQNLQSLNSVNMATWFLVCFPLYDFS